MAEPSPEELVHLETISVLAERISKALLFIDTAEAIMRNEGVEPDNSRFILTDGVRQILTNNS